MKSNQLKKQSSKTFKYLIANKAVKSGLLLLFIGMIYGLYAIVTPTTPHHFSNLNKYTQVTNNLLSNQQYSAVDQLIEDSYTNTKINHDVIALRCVNTVLKADKIALEQKSLNETSTRLYFKAIHLAKHNNRTDLELFSRAFYAHYLYNNEDDEGATNQYITLIPLLDKNQSTHLFLEEVIYQRLAYFLSGLSDYQNVIYYLKKSIDLSKENLSIKAASLDNLANFYIKLNDLKSAKVNLQKAMETAKAIPDNNRMSRIYANYGLLYFKEKNYSQALESIQKGLELSIENQQHKNTIYIYLLQGKCNIALGNVQQAVKAIQEINQIQTISPNSYLQLEDEVLLLKLQISLLQKDTANELKYRRMLEGKEKGIIQLTQDANVSSISLWKIRNLQQTIETLNKKAEQQSNSSRNRLLIISIVALIIIAILVIYLLQRTNKNKRLEFQLQMNELHAEIEHSEQKLKDATTSLADYLHQKNEHIQRLENKLSETERIFQDKQELIKNQDAISDTLRTHLMTDENWKVFKQLFIQEYPEFYHSITAQYPELSETNLKLIFLLKLKMSNLEIANLLGVTPAAVIKAKQRLKKKYPDAADFLLGEQID